MELTECLAISLKLIFNLQNVYELPIDVVLNLAAFIKAKSKTIQSSINKGILHAAHLSIQYNERERAFVVQLPAIVNFPDPDSIYCSIFMAILSKISRYETRECSLYLLCCQSLAKPFKHRNLEKHIKAMEELCSLFDYFFNRIHLDRCCPKHYKERSLARVKVSDSELRSHIQLETLKFQKEISRISYKSLIDSLNLDHEISQRRGRLKNHEGTIDPQRQMIREFNNIQAKMELKKTELINEGFL